MRAGSILFLAVIAVAPAGCTAASFGLGTEEDPDTGAEADASDDAADSVTLDTSSPETADGIADATDSFAPETVAETVPETVAEVLDADAAADVADSAKAEAEVKPPSRCEGKGVTSGHVAVLFDIPPCCARPSGCLTFAASVNGAAWKDPTCSASTGGQNSLMCDFGSSATSVTFLVGVANACGGAIDPTRPISSAANATYLACRGDVELGYCDSTGCTGTLSWVIDKFKLSV